MESGGDDAWGAEVDRLVAQRDEARAARDFARADTLRARIRELGYDVKDAPDGTQLVERPRLESVDLATIPDHLSGPPTLDASVHVVYEGHEGDVERFLSGMALSAAALEIVIVDNAGEHGERLDRYAKEHVRIVHLVRPVGWAEARNGAMRTSRGEILVVADLSVEPLGDVLAPLAAALGDPTVGICGPWGVVTRDLRDFHESPGPEVHAIEGYLMGLRRDTFARASFDPWFTWYRHADLDFSFRVRALGLRALVVPVPAERHEHRGWAAMPEADRARRSKRNFYRFLDRWRDRPDLYRTPSGAEGPATGHGE